MRSFQLHFFIGTWFVLLGSRFIVNNDITLNAIRSLTNLLAKLKRINVVTY